MTQLKTSESNYDHLFWAMAMAIALMLWWLTTFVPAYAYVAGNAIIAAVLVGWLTAMWQGNASAAGAPVATGSTTPEREPAPAEEAASE